MNMKRVIDTCKWLTRQAEILERQLNALIETGDLTELEANRHFRWFIFQTAKRILTDSIDKNMPLPHWRGKEG